MKVTVFLFIFCVTTSCRAMNLLKQLFGGSEVSTTRQAAPLAHSSTHLLDLLAQKKFDAALQLNLSDRELAKAPSCLALAVLVGATPKFIEDFRKYYRLNKQHYLLAVDAACSVGSVQIYNAIVYERMDFEGLESSHIAESSIEARIMASANGHIDLLARLMKNCKKQRPEVLSVDINQSIYVNSPATRPMSGYPLTFPLVASPACSGKIRHTLPLHAAIDRGHITCAILLLLNDADPELADHQHDTPLSIARSRNIREMIVLIELFVSWNRILQKINQLKEPAKKEVALRGLLNACPLLGSCFLEDIDDSALLDNFDKVSLDFISARLRNESPVIPAISCLEKIKASLANSQIIEKVRSFEETLSRDT